jgi:Lon protease-like protein
MSSRLPRRIPIFPLPDAVFFPQMPLPLHVFEPRYREMVKDVLAGDRVIGMTLLQPGWEADYEGRPKVFPVGCAGTVDHAEPLADGRYNIVLRGLGRFRILGEQAGRAYRIAEIEPLAERGADDAAALGEARRKALEALGRAAQGSAVVVLQTDLPDEVFVNALCQSLPLTALERQSLLELDSVLGRCRQLTELLEFRLLERSAGRGPSGTVH